MWTLKIDFVEHLTAEFDNTYCGIPINTLWCFDEKSVIATIKQKQNPWQCQIENDERYGLWTIDYTVTVLTNANESLYIIITTVYIQYAAL